MEKTILSVSGRSGLFVLVSRGYNTLIVETLDEQKKRFSVGLRDKVTSLNDVSMYTEDEDVRLLDVFRNIRDQHQSQPVDIDPKKADKAQLEEFMAKALPNYDRDRVYPNDIKKLITWYNILVKNGVTDFEEPEEEGETAGEVQ